MQKNKWHYLLLAALFTSHLSMAGSQASDGLSPKNDAQTVADTPTSHGGVMAPLDAAPRDNSMGRLEDIQAKTLLYEAQLAQAKALNELQKNGYDTVLGAPFNPQPAAVVKDGGSSKPAQESQTLPMIVEISGGQQLSATLQLDGGNQVRVQTGSRIPGTAWTVAKITFSEVTVSSPDKGLVSLAFAG